MEFITTLYNLFLERQEFFIKLLIEHIYLSTISILIIGILGLIIGIIMTKNDTLARVLLNIVNILYTIPSIAMFGLLVSITGIGNTTAVIALVLYGLLPVIKNTYVGINEVDPCIIEAAKGMGTTDMQLLYKVQLPLASPVIFAGFRTSVVMTIALGTVASFIGAGGLGVAIWRGITTNFKEMTMAGSILVALLAIIIDYIMAKIEKYFNNLIK